MKTKINLCLRNKHHSPPHMDCNREEPFLNPSAYSVSFFKSFPSRLWAIHWGLVNVFLATDLTKKTI